MQRIQRHGYYGIRGARAAYKIFIRGCTMDINHIMALEVLWPNVRFVSGAAPWINMVLEVLRLHIRFVSGAATWILWYYY